MDYLQKIRTASLKVAAMLQNVGQDIGLAASASTEKVPSEAFVQRFQMICQIFDNLAKVESDVEAEKILYESKIHEHVKQVLGHIHAEDEAWFWHSLSTNPESNNDEFCGSDEVNNLSKHPCIDIFVQNRYMDELCSRARQDRPRGSLPLVLAMVTSILRNVRYPLVSHQTVHKSIYQLILDASSISSMYNSISKNKQLSSREVASYAKKVDTQLVSLLASLWMKISNDPELLGHFIFVDKRNGVKHHLDAISCLIPLMGKPKIGAIAKEALLTSISMHDPRIDSFILNETNLTLNIIAELTKKFQNCVSTLTLSANFGSEPVSTGTDRHPHAVDPPAASAEKQASTLGVESFVKVLHFCVAVVAAGSTHSLLQSDPSLSYAIRPVLLTRFTELFLPALKACLLENGEEQVLAAQGLVRRLLLEVFAAASTKAGEDLQGDEKAADGDHLRSPTECLIAGFSKKRNPLCSTLAGFLCGDEDTLQVLIRRVGSVSRSVSVSAMQLLSCLLSICSLSEGYILVNRSSNIHSQSVFDTSNAASARNPSNAAFCFESFLLQHMALSDELALIDYSRASITHILGKLANNVDHIHFDNHAVGVGSGSFFMVSFNKLQSFLSLTYDEQLAVTGLINKCTVELLASALLLKCGEEIQAVFVLLTKFFEEVHKIKTEVADHMVKIPDVQAKCEIIREVLAAPTLCLARNRKYADKENHQVVRILESSIIVEELMHEMEGAVFAYKQLLTSLSNNIDNICFVSGRAQSSVADMTSQSFSLTNDDSWSTDEDDDHTAEGGTDGVGTDSSLNKMSPAISSPPLTVDSFLLECEDMEMQLEQVLASISTAAHTDSSFQEPTL